MLSRYDDYISTNPEKSFGGFGHFFLLLFALQLVETVGLLYPGGCLVLASLHQLPPLPALAVRLDDRVLSFPFFLDFRKVAFEVVQFVGHSLEFLLCVDLGVGESEHFFVVGVDELDELSLVGSFLAFGFVLKFEVIVSQFLQFTLFSRNLAFEFVLARFMILDETVVKLFVFLADLFLFFLLVILDLSYLTLEFVDFFLFVLRMFGSLLPQFEKFSLVVGFGLLQGFNLELQFLNHLCVRVLLFCGGR